MLLIMHFYTLTLLPFAAEPRLPLTYRLALGHVLPLPQPGPWGRARRLSVQVGAPWGIDRIDTTTPTAARLMAALTTAT